MRKLYDQYEENFKMLCKKTKINLNKWRDISSYWETTLNLMKMLMSLK